MSGYRDFTAPAGLRTRGTVLVLPGRGESHGSYARFGARLAADAYRVRVLPAAEIDPARAAAALTAAVDTLGEDPARPLVLAGADTGAAVLAALVARPAPDAAWWPEAVVLAGLPGYGGYRAGGWDEELDARTHCGHHDVLNDLQHRSVAAEIVSFLEALRAGSPLRPLVEAAA